MTKFEFDMEDAIQVSLALKDRMHKCELFAQAEASTSDYWAKELEAVKRAAERLDTLLRQLDALETEI